MSNLRPSISSTGAIFFEFSEELQLTYMKPASFYRNRKQVQ